MQSGDKINVKVVSLNVTSSCVSKKRKRRHYRTDKSFYYKEESYFTGEVTTEILLKVEYEPKYPADTKTFLGRSFADQKMRLWKATGVSNYEFGKFVIHLQSFRRTFCGKDSIVNLDDFSKLLNFDLVSELQTTSPNQL